MSVCFPPTTLVYHIALHQNLQIEALRNLHCSLTLLGQISPECPLSPCLFLTTVRTKAGKASPERHINLLKIGSNLLFPTHLDYGLSYMNLGTTHTILADPHMSDQDQRFRREALVHSDGSSTALLHLRTRRCHFRLPQVGSCSNRHARDLSLLRSYRHDPTHPTPSPAMPPDRPLLYAQRRLMRY